MLTSHVAFVSPFTYWTKGEGRYFLESANVRSEHFQRWVHSEILKGDRSKGRSKILELGRCSENDSRQTGVQRSSQDGKAPPVGGSCHPRGSACTYDYLMYI